MTKGQIISTVAGGGSGGDGVPATAGSVYNPNGMAFDKKGNLYFCSNLGHKVWKVDIHGILTTVAGVGTAGYSGDGGAALHAQLNQPTDLAIDNAGNIIIADAANNRIRKIDVSTGIIKTIAGTGVMGYHGDGGSAMSAIFNQPSCVCLGNDGSVYIGDYGNYRVRKIDLMGNVQTYAGNGLSGWGGDGGPATNAFCSPQTCIRMDRFENLYIAEWGNGVVRRVSSMGIIETLAGDTTSYSYNGDNIPAKNCHLAPAYLSVSEEGILYVSDYNNHRIRVIKKNGYIHTVSGNGTGSNTGDNGEAIAATVHLPTGQSLDSCGNLYFGQNGTPRIRKIAFNPTCAPTSIADAGKEDKSISIHPNPATTHISITLGTAINTVVITNMLGQSFYNHTMVKSTEKAEVDISHLPPGMYLVRVNDKWVQRFMKE
ncbi:MAG: T9SS type A sorting domain-containing protein [Taibaiella sp.]|nr:T9SS type A sorting domain-containing protein [Taibaiella sp.]